MPHKPLPWITFPKTRAALESAVDRVDVIIEIARDEASEEEFRFRSEGGTGEYFPRVWTATESRFWETLRDHLSALAERAES